MLHVADRCHYYIRFMTIYGGKVASSFDVILPHRNTFWPYLVQKSLPVDIAADFGCAFIGVDINKDPTTSLRFMSLVDDIMEGAISLPVNIPGIPTASRKGYLARDEIFGAKQLCVVILELLLTGICLCIYGHGIMLSFVESTICGIGIEITKKRSMHGDDTG